MVPNFPRKKKLVGCCKVLLALILFNILINDLDKCNERMLIRFSEGTKLSERVNTSEDRISIQDALNKLENWSNKGKYACKCHRKDLRDALRIGAQIL